MTLRNGVFTPLKPVGTTDAAPAHWRADKVSHAGGLDGYGGDGIVRAAPQVPQPRALNTQPTTTNFPANPQPIQERAGVFVAFVTGGEVRKP